MIETHELIGPGGAAFVGMRLLECNFGVRSSGSLASGPGELADKVTLVFSGQASPSLKELLDTPAGRLCRLPLQEHAALVDFISPKGRFRYRCDAQYAVSPGKAANDPATLRVTIEGGLGEGGPAADELLLPRREVGTLVVRPAPADQGELALVPGDTADKITIHAPGQQLMATDGATIEEDIERMEWLLENDEKAAVAAPVRRRRKTGKELAADQGNEDEDRDVPGRVSLVGATAGKVYKFADNIHTGLCRVPADADADNLVLEVPDAQMVKGFATISIAPEMIDTPMLDPTDEAWPTAVLAKPPKRSKKGKGAAAEPPADEE